MEVVSGSGTVTATGAGPRFSAGRALVVGVADYEDVTPLPEAVLNDARDVAGTLLSPGHCGYDPARVTTLLDAEATSARIREALRELADGTRPGDTALVFFSGHGGRIRLGAGHATLLVPVDYRPADPLGTGLPADELSDALAAIPAERLLVVLDACHSGGAASLKSGDRTVPGGFADDDLRRLAQGKGRVVLASSRADETSLVLGGARNSVFTAAFLEALRGGGQTRGDGLVRVFDVFNHVAAGVRRAVPGRQRPVLKANDLEDDFPVALDQGGAKGPALRDRAPSATARRVEDVLAELYPLGPTDDEIWSRAGGDLARLDLSGSGRAMWLRAVRMARLGGGVPLGMLLGEALRDYPHHRELKALLDAH